jgi:hypothetical protein
MVKSLCPSKHYFLSDIMIFRQRVMKGIPSSFKHMNVNINEKVKEHKRIKIQREHLCENDARVITIQREQYDVTVHLFIGTGRSPGKSTFMSLVTIYNINKNY